MLNEDARSHWLGRDNVGYAMIKGKQMPVLLDMGANVNMITPECVVALGLQMGLLTDLHEGGITIDQPFNYEQRLIGYVIMSMQIDGISGYNEDQVALMAHSSCRVCTSHSHNTGDSYHGSGHQGPQREQNRQISHPVGMCEKKHFALGSHY